MRVLKVLLFAVLGFTALAVLAFGPRADEALPHDRVIVDYWEAWTGVEAAALQQIVDSFNETVGKDKGIFVRCVTTSSINQKTLVATAAGVPPDIAGLYDGNLVQFAAMDALEPLEDLAREHGIKADQYKPIYWNALNYQGHLYGLISTPTVTALVYNKRLMRESAEALRAAGLDPDRPPKTIDELNAYADALTVRDASGHLVRTGFIPMEPNWYANVYCYWFGGPYWDAEHKKFILTSEPVVRAYEWLGRYAKSLGRDAMSDFRNGMGTFASAQHPFMSEQVVMELQGPFLANFIYTYKPSMSTRLWPKDVEMTKPIEERRKNYDWAVAPFPTAVPGLENVAYCGFDCFTIPRGAKHKKEAFEFLAYTQRQDVMERLNMLHCKTSPLINVSNEFYERHQNPYIDVYDQLTRSPNARTVPQIPIQAEVDAELNALNQAVSILQVEPREALARIQVKLQNRYDEFMAQQRKRHPELSATSP